MVETNHQACLEPQAAAAMAGPLPFVSVVIPTRQRANLLRRCLLSLGRQQYPRDRYEIIVVDDDRDVAANGTIEKMVRSLGLGCGVSYARNAGQGPAAARNVGWRQAKGEIIAFTDDDAIPAPDWISEGIKAFHDGVTGVAGSTVVPLPKTPSDYQRNVGRLQYVQFITCNVFYRRESLEMAGGFDPSFREAYREDTDLNFKIIECGGRLSVARDAIVYHPARPGRFLASLAAHRRLRYDALLHKKHPELYRAGRGRGAPLDYYLMVGASIGALTAAWRGTPWLAGLLALLWGALDARFCHSRLRGTSRRPGDVLDVVISSILIPFAAIFWRLYGAVRYRTLFW